MNVEEYLKNYSSQINEYKQFDLKDTEIIIIISFNEEIKKDLTKENVFIKWINYPLLSPVPIKLKNLIPFILLIKRTDNESSKN